MMELLGLSKRLALEAGNFLKSEFETAQAVLSETGKDIKTVADRGANALITSQLSSLSPYPVLSEEGSHDWAGKDEFGWVVDPLDGTFNYCRGLDYCCVSIALCKGAHPVLGVVNDFNRGDLYWAVSGEGAYCNGKSISVSKISCKEKAVLSTGFPVKTSYDDNSLYQFVTAVKSFKKIRCIGSAAMSLTLVAKGSVDAYFENDIMIWDVAAGILLVKEAGGVYQMEASSKENSAFKVQAAASSELFS